MYIKLKREEKLRTFVSCAKFSKWNQKDSQLFGINYIDKYDWENEARQVAGAIKSRCNAGWQLLGLLTLCSSLFRFVGW